MRVTKCVNSAKIGQDDRGIGTGIVLVAQVAQRVGDIAAHQRLEQIDDAGAVGEAEHLPHVLGRARRRRACAIA